MASTDMASGAEAAPDPLAGAAPAEAPGPRALMVRKLIDIVVLPPSRLSANERSLVADILLQIAAEVEEELRIEIARRIARTPEIPPALLRMLLLDEPAVARRIIEGADQLPEALLIEAARLGSTAHRALIARRVNVTTAVADVLIAANEPDIAKLLLKRDEFALSPHAVDLLVSRSTTDRELQSLLLRRRELEPAHGFIMFWWVGSEHRRRILARFALDRSIIQDALEDLYPRVFRSPVSDPVAKEVLIMLDRRNRPRTPAGELISMDIVKQAVAAARLQPTHEIIEAVAMIARVSRELAGRILRDPGGEPYAILCKSLGITREDFFGFVSVGVGEQDRREIAERAEHLLAIFDSMARDFARAILRYWDWSGNPRIAGITNLVNADDGAAFAAAHNIADEFDSPAE